MSEERNWQDVMIEHRQNGTDKYEWHKQANSEGIMFCGRLCDTILKLEEENAAIIKMNEQLKNRTDELFTEGKVYKWLLHRYSDNVEYYKSELAGSWIDIYSDAKKIIGD